MSALSQDVVYELAVAVAKPKGSALLIAEDNTAVRDAQGQERWLTIADAAASQMAFAVEAREHLLALDADFDKPESPPAWLEVAKQECRDAGCYTVEVTSGSPTGSRHLWISTPVGWTSAEFADRLKKAGVPAANTRNGQRTRPPLSPHRRGGQGVLLEPTTWMEARDLLRNRPRQTSPSPTIQRRLREGAGDEGRDRLAMAIATSYVNANLGLPRFRQDMLHPTNVGGRKAQELPLDKQGPYLSKKYEDARRFVRDNPAQEGRDLRRQQVCQLEASLQRTYFTGRERSDRLVYQYLVRLAVLLTNPELNCSVRQLAKALGVSTNATHRALQRLVGRHRLLEQLEPGSAGQATRWRVLPKADATVDTNYLPWGAELIGVHPSVAFSTEGGLHPAFSHSGLPSDAGLLWQAMDSEHGWYRVGSMLSLAPGLSRATILKHLKALHSAGLVEPKALRSWYWRKLDCLPSYLDKLADRFGSSQQRRRQERKLQREMDDFNLGESHRARSSPCMAFTRAGRPCRALAMQITEKGRSDHCWAHASEDDRRAGQDLWSKPLERTPYALAT